MSAGIPNIRVVSSAGTSVTVTGLQRANTYKFRVRAVDAAGNTSAWSDEIVAVTTENLPLPTVAATTAVAAPVVTAQGLTTQTLFTNQTPGTTNIFDNAPLTVATTVVFAQAGALHGIRYFAPTTVTGTFTAALYRVDTADTPGTGTGTLLGTQEFGAITPGAWNTVLFSSPIAVQTNTAYRVAVRTSLGRYTATGGFFSSAALVNQNITGTQSSTNPVGIGTLMNGAFVADVTSYPNQYFNHTSYFVDPVYAATPVGQASVSLAVVAGSASVPTMSVGGTPPTLIAGRPRPVTWGQSVQLGLRGASPPSGHTLTGYSWQIISGAGSLTNPTGSNPDYVAPASGSGLVTVRATVTSSNGGQASVDSTVSYHQNIVAAENALPGTARATWDLASPNLGGVSTLQGFCDGFSINKTETANFKIAQSDTAGWTAEVFRLGYYNGDGARTYGTITPSGAQVTASQAQPAPTDADPDTTLLSASCSGWSTTLTWTPPAWAPSGIYILRLNRTGGGASHITFVVRDDARVADLTVMPADSTWNAYNAWGGMGSGQYAGNSLYYGTAVNQYHTDCARYVSYDRPMVNRGAADSGRDYGAVEWSTFFTSEYPMVRFLERNGIDAKYYSCLDAAGDAAGTHLIGNGSTRGGSKAAMMLGHNEYWSDGMRSGWEAASAAGVSIFTCASNEVFWRLVGSSPDASGRPRIWECYKSTISSRSSTGRSQWTGTWRDPDGTGKGGNNPENKLTGTIFAVNGPDMRSLVVPATGGYAAQPIWRHTSVASLTAGQSYTSGSQILGFEWDVYGPAGVTSNAGAYMAAPDPRTRYCSDATYAISGLLLDDAGDVYVSGNATHRLVVKPGGNGGMVFGTGSMNWAFGCDNANVYQAGSDNSSTVIQQATVNMLTDMGAAPASLMSGLTQPTAVDWFVDAGMTTIVTTAGVTTFGITTGTRHSLTLPVVATANVPALTPNASVAGSLATVAAVAAVATPTITAGTGAAAASLTVAATSAVPAQQVRTGAGLTASAVSAAAAIPAPAVMAGAGAAVAPQTVMATSGILSFGQQVGTSSSLATVAATAAVPAPSATASSQATPGAVAATVSIPSISASAGSSSNVGPSTATATAAVGAMTFRSNAGVQLSTLPAEADVLSPGVISGSATTVNLNDVEAVAAVGALTFRSAAAAALAAVAGSAAVPTLSVRLGVSRTLTVVTATAVIPTPQTSAEAGSGVGLAPVSATAALPPVSARTGSSVTGQHASGSASVPTLAVRITLVARPTTVTATVMIWQPSLGADSLIQISAVLAKAAIPLPRLLMIPLVFAHPHQVLVTRGTHNITISRRSG